MMPIHFAHANGFPAPVYRQLFSALEREGFSISGLAKHGHDPDFPVTDGWSYLVDELLEAILVNHTEPVLAVGHSFGGVLSLFASFQMPELFQAVIILDAPLLTHLECGLIRLIKRLGGIDRVTPAGKTQRRRSVWRDRQEAMDYCQGKSLFKGFDRQSIADYVDHGMTQDSKGVRLNFDPDIEASIYRTTPDRWPQATQSLPVPTTVVYGDRSDVMVLYRIIVMRLRRQVQMMKVEGGHLFPLERPEQTARMIAQLAVTMGVSTPL